MSIDKSWNAMKGVGEGICVCVCQREGDSLIPSFACPSFISGPCLSGVLCASPGGAWCCWSPSQLPFACSNARRSHSSPWKLFCWLQHWQDYDFQRNPASKIWLNENIFLTSSQSFSFFSTKSLKLLLPCCFCPAVSSRLGGKSFLVVPGIVPAIKHGLGVGRSVSSVSL